MRCRKTCPSCGAPVVRLPDEAFHRCVNRNCPAQIKGSIVHFASREAMNIDGLGERIVSRFIDEGIIRTVSDLYRLEMKDLENLAGFGTKSARNLLDAIEGSKLTTLSKVFIRARNKPCGDLYCRSSRPKPGLS